MSESQKNQLILELLAHAILSGCSVMEYYIVRAFELGAITNKEAVDLIKDYNIIGKENGQNQNN